MVKTKILVVGLGGVGGYFGGLLAKAYRESQEVEIYFLSRGQNLQKIESDGLWIYDDQEEFYARPKMVSDNALDFGLIDYVLLCTKTYGLRRVAQQIAPCIKDSTVLIPLQNGVNNREILLEFYPSNLVTHACVYLVSRLESPGHVVKKGSVASLFFGWNGGHDKRLHALQEILVNAGINSELSSEIERITWEKFIFLSSIATATTYFDANIHEILRNEEKLDHLKSLIQEVTALARSKVIAVIDQQVDRVLSILSSLPPDATSSMHSDFRNKAEQTELASLTGYVVEQGRLNKINVTTFESMLTKLKMRNSNNSY